MSLSQSCTSAVTVATARTALFGFKRQNFDVEPDDTAQVQAYITLRETLKRVSPTAFMKYLQGRVKNVQHGETVSLEFWAVPKTNFPKGLPAKIADAVVDAGDAEDLQVDRSKFFVIDKVVAREHLGKQVWTVSKYMAMDTRCALPSSDDDDNTLSVADQPRGSSHVALNTTRKPPKRRLNDWLSGDDYDDEPEESAEFKKARSQLATLQMLKGNIIKARDDNIWVHRPGSINSSSVRFWVEQTVQALEELTKESADKHSKMVVTSIVQKFRTFLIQLVQSAHCYPEWCKFAGIFQRLATICGEHVDEAKLLESLANVALEGDSTPSVDGISVFATAAFYACPCYLSFVSARAGHALNEAFAANDNAKRITILEPLRGTQGLSHASCGISDSIECALKLFDDRLALSVRVAYMHSQPDHAVKMAVHWDGTGPVGTAGKLLQNAPDFADVTYSNFKLASQAIVRAELVHALPSPLLKQAVSFVDAIDPHVEGKETLAWAECIVGNALAVRLGCRCDAQPDPTKVPQDKSHEVYKRTKEFLAHLPKSVPQPTWLQGWKSAIDAEKQKSAAVAAEAKERTDAKANATAATAADAKEMTEANANATAATESAPDAAACSATAPDVVGKAFAVGQQVSILGKNGLYATVGVIDEILTKHCWVRIDDNQGDQSSLRKKIMKEKLRITLSDGTREKKHVGANGALAADAPAGESLAADAWKDCGEVFES